MPPKHVNERMREYRARKKLATQLEIAEANADRALSAAELLADNQRLRKALGLAMVALALNIHLDEEPEAEAA